MDLELSGKRAIVTGASRGIGKAIALALAHEGVDLVLASRTAAPLEASALGIADATKRKVVAITADTGDDQSVKALVKQAAQALGGVDILVNNAAIPGGAGPAARVSELTTAALLTDVNVKVAGYLRLAQAVAPYQIEAGWGRIINIGGLAARSTGQYIASVRNAAVSALTKNLADEFGPLGVTAVAIHPGATRTERTTPEQEQAFSTTNSVRRLIDASDIAWLVTVLASPRSIAINGETIAAGGGTPKVINY
ncbi:MAG: SDR family NAD(P)-dependent oxidoreductase [Caulobacteraceae bacterium]|nr:SDR family NAD(P)-dependent oxidoreductase [Caulobacteraceae bacterium]